MPNFQDHFILTKKPLKTRLGDNFKEIKIDKYNLFVDEQISRHSYSEEDYSVYLFGFAFHIENSNLSEGQILKELPRNEDELLNYLDYLCGNYLVIIVNQGEVSLYHDATAVFKVFYYREGDEIIAAASDIAMLKAGFSLSFVEHKDALEYYNSNFFLGNKNRPGEKTMYKNVEQLTPNKRLNFTSNQVERYFPREVLRETNLEEAAIQVKKYFDNVLGAANKRFNIKCSMTSGWDSRMCVLLTKDLKDEVEYYTFKFERLSDKSDDIVIPKRISKELGLKHTIIDFHNTEGEPIRELLNENYELITELRIRALMKGFSRFEKGKDIALLGTVSEICKNYYDVDIVVDGKSLTKAAQFPLNNYSINHFTEKYEELNELCRKCNFELTDIVHWEQDVCNMAAQHSFHDMFVIDALSPFNSRKIITTILAVPKHYRDKQSHDFYQLMFKKYWPELGEIPVNPDLKTKLIRLSKKMGVYKPYKKLSTKLRK